MNKVIVVGGGIVGLSVSWRLAQLGVNVTLLEANENLGEGATRASFAWINANNKTPEPYFQLNQDGMDHYRHLQQELEDPRWLHFSGNVQWSDSAEGTATMLEKIERLQAWGYSAEILSVEELRNIEPALVAPETVEKFAYFPQEGFVNQIDMMGDLAARSRELGVDLRTGTRAASLTEQSGEITGVRTESDEEIKADLVVVAIGSSVADLLSPLGVEVPMASNVGVTAVTSPTVANLQTIVHHSGKVHFRPEGAGRIVFASGGVDAQVEREAPELPAPAPFNDLLAEVEKVMPLIRGARIDSVHLTTRPVPADGLPFVGHVPNHSGLYLMTMHSGITLGPLMGQIAAREITTSERDSRLEPSRPGRSLQEREGKRHQN